MQTEREKQKCAVVALIGAPNAGKSTLVNQLTGAKVSIVTHKVQTTRARIRGIAIEGDSQLVLVDTPGIFAPKRRLDRAMVEAAWGGARDADITVLLIDAAKGLDAETESILDGLGDIPGARVLVLNKVDLVKKNALLELTAAISNRQAFDATFMISALQGDGVRDLKAHLAQHARPGPWLYPEDQISDAPLRHLAAEITREKLTLRLHQELPYASTVETTLWKELKNGRVRIEQTVYVMRDSQKKIVLGKNGQTIKAISMESRKELSEIVEKPVDLFLFVKVRQKWGDDPERYMEMGLEFPND
ncbi:MAG: GTPase Era [Hyphomicrobiaceae bacterium]|nr:GTPase Era [Hyphomicrobiaceae bacterium]